MKKTIRTKTKDYQKFIINVRCNDECGNGHDTFAITGEGWRTEKSRDCEIGGCIHDEILKVRPDLKLLVDLHLSDGDGVPMYAVENGYYHLQGYMGTAKYDHKMTRKGVAEYLRVSEDEIQRLADNNICKENFVKWVEKQKPVWLDQSRRAKELIKSL